ncbi:DUF1534 domain-containing protein [Pseudomonas congelans]|nr:DUF1534 domain-containing protein [Pseudomonas congelans]
MVPTLQRGNAVLDAPRPIFTYQHAYKIPLLTGGRGSFRRLQRAAK